MAKQQPLKDLQDFVSEPKLATFVPLLRSFARREIPLDNIPLAVDWAKKTQHLLATLHGTEWQKKMGLKFRRVPSMFIRPEQIFPGLFYSFHYEAATVDDWDVFPVTLILSRDDTHALGLNFHYLPYEIRYVFFTKLIPFVAPIPVTILSQINITYNKLKQSNKLREYKPCIHRYRLDQIQSKILFITPLEWPVAIAYPSGKFEGKPMRVVWKESLAKIR